MLMTFFPLDRHVLRHSRVTTKFAYSRLVKGVDGIRDEEPSNQLPFSRNRCSTHRLVHARLRTSRKSRGEAPGFVSQKVQFAPNDEDMFGKSVAGAREPG
ncbi:hypothetical protein MSAN_01761500 [Mycena sanguinolenta]|uniref:Uncharacterized protein n=1 Tax=Mycena sanguinolenta TaxID=230812 RepID=A0A8H6XWM9_9AGAR|nr:hypothetical protein MSAN_01761500 [Mycena sanguinolenta]